GPASGGAGGAAGAPGETGGPREGGPARRRAPPPPFFDEAGDRRSGTGEHVVVLRPVFPGDLPARPQTDATLEVYTRQPGGSGWGPGPPRPPGRSPRGRAAWANEPPTTPPPPPTRRRPRSAR